MLSDVDDEKKDEIILSDEPFEEVMIDQISMLLSQYEEDIRTLLDEQSDVREMKPLFQVFKQKERVYVKKWAEWLKNYGKDLEKSQFFLESDKAAALKMYFSNTLLHIRLLAENAIELAEINCKLRAPDAPTSTHRKDWKQIFNVLSKPAPQKEITSFQLGESLRQAIAKTAKKIEITFQQTPQLVDSLFRLGSKLKTNLLWWLHAHRLEMVRGQFFSDKKSSVKTEKTEPAAIQADASPYPVWKKEQSNEKDKGNGYAQYLSDEEEEKLESQPLNPLDNQAIVPFFPPFSSAASTPYATQVLARFSSLSDENKKLLLPNFHLIIEKCKAVNAHLEASEQRFEAWCKKNDERFKKQDEALHDYQQKNREIEKRIEDLYKRQEETREIEKQIDDLDKRQEKTPPEQGESQPLEALRKHLEEKEEETAKKLDERERELERKLDAERRLREEGEQEIKKEIENLRKQQEKQDEPLLDEIRKQQEEGSRLQAEKDKQLNDIRKQQERYNQKLCMPKK